MKDSEREKLHELLEQYRAMAIQATDPMAKALLSDIVAELEETERQCQDTERG